MRADCLLALGRIEEARTLFRTDADARPQAAAPLVGLAKCDLLQDRVPVGPAVARKGALEERAATPRPTP